jgi:predicted  nucleic acid-binding Zn-ribbon protein
MPTEEAVRYVINAERNFEILEYHADVILHALIPDRVPKPTEGNVPRAEQADAASNAVAGAAREGREPEEETMSAERKALDQQLKDGIDMRQDMYRSIRGNKDARDKILDGGPDGVRGFLERLSVFTAALLPKLTPYIMKKHDLIVTATGETGVPRKGDIYVNVDDFMAADFEAVQQLAEKVKRDLAGGKGPEAAPAEVVAEVEEENPAEAPRGNGGLPPNVEMGTAKGRAREAGVQVPPERPAGGAERSERNSERRESHDDEWQPLNLYALREEGGRGQGREDEKTFAARARERVAETASRLAERFGIKNLVDSARIAWSGELADWHTGFAVSLKGKMDGKRRTVQDLEGNRRHLQDEFDTFSQEGEVSAKALMRIEKDRAEVEKKIEKNKNEADRLQSRLEYRNNQRARYENRRNEVCRGYMDRVTERLNPFEEKLSDLKLTKGQLEQEIGSHRESLTACRAKVSELKKLVEAEKFPSVRRAHREIVKKIERKAKDLAGEIAAREKDRGRIDKKIVKQDKKANPFRDKLNRLARITRREGPDTRIAPRLQREEASFEARDVSGHPREEGEEPAGPDDVEAAPAERRPELEKRYSGEELVEAWNAINGSRMMIKLDVAKKSFPTFFGGQESASDFLRFAEFYAERYGDEERFEGMPSMKKAAKKRRGRGFWARLFGQGNRGSSQSRLLGALNRRK